MELSVKDVKALLRRRGALLAAVTALAILAVQIGTGAVGVLLTVANNAGFDYPYWEGFGPAVLISALPFSFGVFVCLWIMLPIAPELEMRFVVTRGVAATAVGVVLSLASKSIVSIIQFLMKAGPFDPAVTARLPEVTALFGTLQGHLIASGSQFLGTWPLVILFTIFQWQWLKNHPPKFEVAGILDV